MNQQFLQNLKSLGDFINSEKDFGILIGNHQNIDTVAAALSLYLSLKNFGKNVQIVSTKDPLVEVSGLVGVNKIERSFKGDTTKLVVALPYIKGEVEKVLFTEQKDTINFHLTAAAGRTITPFELDQVKLNWEGASPLNIITIGVGNENELNEVVDINSSKIINVDNFSGNSRFGDIVVVDDTLSSLSEIIGKAIKDQGLPFDVDIAQNILDGVLFATRNFTKANTSPLAFEAASYAMYQGAQRKGEERAQSNSTQRNDQGFSASNIHPSQIQERMNRDQGQFRGSRQQSFDTASFGNAQDKPSDSAQGKQGRQHGNRPQQRSVGSDFPAMHMQGRVSQNQNQGMDNRRMNNPMRNDSNSSQRAVSQFGQNRNLNDIRNKIIEESAAQKPFQDSNEEAQDAQIFEEPREKQPIKDKHIPEDTATFQEDEQSYPTPNLEDVPDDWLMPKVFKSSKNNN